MSSDCQVSGVKMQFRLVFFFFVCYIAAVNCFFQSDEVIGAVRETPAYVRDGVEDSRSERPNFSSSQETSEFGDYGKQFSNSPPKETFGGSPLSEQSTAGFSQSNSENGQYSTSISSNNQEHRPTGGSTHTSGHRENENRPLGYRPSENSFDRPTGSHAAGHREGESRPFGSSSTGESSFNRPTGTSHTAGPWEGESRPSEPRPGSTSENLFERPTTSHTTNHREGENRPSEFRPSSSGEFSRPAEGLSHTTDYGEGNNRPSKPNESSFSRPTGGSSHAANHREHENHPSGPRPGDSSFNKPGGHIGHREEERPSRFGSHEGQALGRPTGENIHNQQTGLRPDNQEETHRPGSQEYEHSNNSEGEKDKNKDGKEEDKDICFHALGCFKMGKPWKSILRPIGAPHGPEKIQTTIHLYTRENLEKPKNITVYPDINMREARFDPSKITAVIVHGFSNSGSASWMRDMKNVYLRKVDANVMIVDWGKGAQLLNYLQVAGNTRVVGKQLGLFVKYLIDNYGADPGKFHLIGHSLGAQICSYLGKEVPGIARLTALDPAQPGFEGFDTEVRLDKNDAEFVDVLHTDARPFIPTLGFGMITPHGHVDFYMNGGFDQPGCVPPAKKELPVVKNILDLAKFPVEVIAKAVACPHARAYEYLIESFNETDNCIFWGHKADVKNVFKSVTNTVTQGLLKKFTALSSTCSKEDCIPVGFATKKSPLRGVFVVTTNGRSPYCISESGVPPETLPHERNHDSFIQKIGRKTGITG